MQLDSRSIGWTDATSKPLGLLRGWNRDARLDEISSLQELSKPLRTAHQLKKLALNPRSADDEFQFAVLGDVEPGRFWVSRKLFNVPGVFARQLRAIQSHQIDFCIQLGDMVSRGTRRNYLRLLREMSRVGVEKPYLTVIGNHDRISPHRLSSARIYRSCFGETNYFFDRGGVRFVVLDTSARRLKGNQLRWLNLCLKTDLRTVVLTHIPPAALRVWTDFASARGVGGFTRGAAEFTEIMADHKVDRVYLGHIHGFGVQDFLGVRYVLSGGGGSPLFPSGASDRFHHYIIVSAGPRGITETVHSLDGGKFHIPGSKIIITHH